MISVSIDINQTKCTKCGKCIKLMDEYCINEINGSTVIDKIICNACQKCVSICPSQAITVNGIFPKTIPHDYIFDKTQFIHLLEKRRSIKHFKDKEIPIELINEIISVAKYAPNQNKNISITVVNNKNTINEIDKYSLLYVNRFYKLLFGNAFIAWFCALFYKDMPVIKKKMEKDLLKRKKILKDNTQVLIILTGNKNTAAVIGSAYCMLAIMMIMAESIGIGSCFMDSIQLSLNSNISKKHFRIKEDVLGVLSLGYSNEQIINIPKGYEPKINYNVFHDIS